MSKVRLTGATSGYTELTAPAVAGSNTLTLPTGNGTADQRLVTNGSGALSFSSDVMLAAGSAGSPSLYFSGDTNTGMWSPAADTLAWSTGGTERARIDTTGNVLFNSASLGFGNQKTVQIQTASTGLVSIQHLNTETSGAAYMWLVYNGGAIGSITQNGTTGVAYNTTSDYRLKENIVPIGSSVTRLLQLKPSRFNFKADPDRTVDGFIAHEAQEVVPECVTGTKDAVDADGNPVMQGIDQSKLVPLLTAALQEALQQIEALTARVTALEAN